MCAEKEDWPSPQLKRFLDSYAASCDVALRAAEKKKSPSLKQQACGNTPLSGCRRRSAPGCRGHWLVIVTRG